MVERCTCGAQLPPDARFCHKCGRPLFDYPAVEAEPVAETVVPPSPAPPEIGFHNKTAVRIGFLAALIAFILFILPLPFPVPRLLVAFLASGLIAVYLYIRRTGQRLNVRAGARMGWITGIFSFMIVMVQFTLGVLASSSHGGVIALFKAQLPPDDPRTQDMLKLLAQPSVLAVMMVFMLLIAFLLLTVLPTLGGVLGAKLFAKEQ